MRSERVSREDRRWMRLALRLARLGLGRTHPNPRVGAVAVREGRVVGLGAHLRHGGAHAEAQLIASAGAGALRGATLYATLEPCHHFGKTPPCTDAILGAGVVRVVAAMEDPCPAVRGRGFAALRAAGVDIEEGCGRRAAVRLNAPYLWRLRFGRALVTLKVASSLDGRLAAADGSSRWITGAEARERVHRWRAGCDALLIGRGTLAGDRPRLTARPRRDPYRRLRRRVAGESAEWPPGPARVVVDSRCAAAEDEGLLEHLGSTPGGAWIVACGARATQERVRRIEGCGARCWRVPESGNGAGVDLAALLERLAQEGYLDLVVEGGATLAGELLRRRLVDRLRVFVAAVLLGGERSWVGDLGIGTLSAAMRLPAPRWLPVGRDALLTGWLPAAEEALNAFAAPRDTGPGEQGTETCSPD